MKRSIFSFVIFLSANFAFAQAPDDVVEYIGFFNYDGLTNPPAEKREKRGFRSTRSIEKIEDESLRQDDLKFLLGDSSSGRTESSLMEFKGSRLLRRIEPEKRESPPRTSPPPPLNISCCLGSSRRRAL